MQQSIEDQLRNLVLEQHQAPASKVTLATEATPQTNVSSNLAVSSGSAGTALAPTSQRALYSHEAMIDLMIAHPEYSHAMLCSHFGRPASWLASVLASDSFQAAVEPRRHLILDPTLTATMQERFKALAIRTSNVMLEKLEAKEVSDFLVLKAGEISIKALGMGQKGVEQPSQPAASSAPQKSLEERLLEALDKRRAAETIEAEDIQPKTNF